MPLKVYESGAGVLDRETIVFLHGAGLSGSMWKPQMERLYGFHCLACDLPEHGESTDVGSFALENASQLVTSLIRQKAGRQGRVHLVGHSLGGAVALTILKDHPELIKTALVTGAPGRMNKALASVMSLNALLYKVLKPEQIAEMMLLQFGIPPEYRPTLTVACRKMTAKAINHVTGALTNLDLPENTDVPLLVLVGQNETLPAKQAARRISRAVAGARRMIVKGAGHVWNLNSPDLFSDTVEAWVSGSALPPQLVPF